MPKTKAKSKTRTKPRTATKARTKSKARPRAKSKARPRAKAKFAVRAKPSSAQLESPLALLFGDLEQELSNTRRVLERVPDGRDDWRPHVKSRTLGELSTHVAQLPGFAILMLKSDEFDGSTRRPEAKPANNAERLKMFEGVSGELRRQFQALTWDRARAPWTLRIGNQVFFRSPRMGVLRTVFFSHLAHHRAQLGVYLRLLDIDVPYTYGASADERPPAL